MSETRIPAPCYAKAVNDASEVPEEIHEALRVRLATGAREVHQLKIALAELALRAADPDAFRLLEVARRFLQSRATAAELAEARQDCWAQVGSLACYCTPTDSLASQAILCCLEADEAQHAPASLSEQALRVLRCGVPAELVLQTLRGLEAHGSDAAATGLRGLR